MGGWEGELGAGMGGWAGGWMKPGGSGGGWHKHREPDSEWRTPTDFKLNLSHVGPSEALSVPGQ